MGKGSISKNKTKGRDGHGRKTVVPTKITPSTKNATTKTSNKSTSNSATKIDTQINLVKSDNQNHKENQKECEKECHKEIQNETQKENPITDKTEVACSLQQMIMVSIEPHRHSGIFLARSRDDAIMLLTRALTPANDESGEQRFSADMFGKRNEYRSWSPFQSKLGAAILSGVSNIHIGNGSKVLYLSSGFGRTIPHIADIVGESGKVYAVDRGAWSQRELATLSRKYTNIIPIIDDATMPYKYRKIITDYVDMIFIDMPQTDQIRILYLNARHYLKSGGHFAIVLQSVNCCEGNAPSKEEIYANEMKRLKQEQLETLERIILEPYIPGDILVVGQYNLGPMRLGKKEIQKEKQHQQQSIQ